MPHRPHVIHIGPSLHSLGALVQLLKYYSDNIPEFTFRPSTTTDGRFSTSALVKLFARLPFLKIRGFNILHIHATSARSFRDAVKINRWGRFLGFKTIFHCHGGNFHAYAEIESRKNIIKQLNRFNALALPTERWQEYYCRAYQMPQTYVVHNMVEDIAVQRNRSKRRSNEPVRLLYMGSLERNKGIFDLLSAISVLKDKCPNMELNICTDADRSEVFEVITHYGIEDYVRFKGYVTGDDKDRILRLNDIMIIPSYMEGMPMQLLEAAVYAMPCIASRVGAIDDFIDNKVNGLLITPGRVDEITEAISYYLDNPTEIVSHGTEARARITQFFPENVCEELNALHSKVLE